MNKQRGQTLLEILLAFSILILALGSIVLGVTTSLSNTQYTKNQGLANSYAQEGMAVVRQKRDSSWTDFYDLGNGNFCTAGNSSRLDSMGSSSCDNIGIFSRKILLKMESPQCCSNNSRGCSDGLKGSQVTVTVSWADSKCSAGPCHKVELITCFFSLDTRGI